MACGHHIGQRNYRQYKMEILKYLPLPELENKRNTFTVKTCKIILKHENAVNVSRTLKYGGSIKKGKPASNGNRENKPKSND